MTLPTAPLAGAATPYNVPQPFGIATNGVIIDPFAAEWFSGDRESGWQLARLFRGEEDRDQLGLRDTARVFQVLKKLLICMWIGIVV